MASNRGLTPEMKAKALKLLNSEPLQQNDLKYYPCKHDYQLISAFYEHPGAAIGSKLLGKESFKITTGNDSSHYRQPALYKRGSVLYKVEVGGKSSHQVTAFLIKPNPKNPSEPRLCKFLSYDAFRYTKLPSIMGSDTGSTTFLGYNLEHPLFPFEIFNGYLETGFLGVAAASVKLSKDQAEKYAKAKKMLKSLEDMKIGSPVPVKSNDFSATINVLGISGIKLTSEIFSEENIKDVKVTQPESREQTQKEIWKKLDKAFNEKQKGGEPQTAKSFLPKTVEELVLKIYYLQCQFELDEEVSCEIFKTWFRQHPDDQTKIDALVKDLLEQRFDQDRLNLNIVYSADELKQLLKKAIVELQATKTESAIVETSTSKPKETEVECESEEKLESKKKLGKDFTLFASKDINLYEATDILKMTLIPYTLTTPGVWRKFIDDEKSTVFEIGVSKSVGKPGLVYKNFQIQLESETSPLTVLDKSKTVEVNGKKVFKTLSGSEAEKQIIRIAKALQAYNQNRKDPENSNCFVM